MKATMMGLASLALVACAGGTTGRGSGGGGMPGVGVGTDGNGSTSGDADDDDDDDDADTDADGDDDDDDDGLILDVGAPDEGGGCEDPDDICCLMEGEIPPHVLLDAFLAAYPTPNMPKTVDELESFNPIAAGVTVAYQATMSGGEWVDPVKDGITDANVLLGLDEARQRAEMAVPADAVVLDVREDPVQTDLGGDECVGSSGATGDGGIGWAWGSILFQTPDLAIGEVVYLYIGLCLATEDTEGYYYAEDPLQVCEPPG